MALDKYRSTDDTIYDQVGPCLVSGHPQEHKLQLVCLAEMRRFFYSTKTFKDFLDAVKRK